MIERLKKLQSDKSRYPNGRVLAQSLTSNQSLRDEVKKLGKHFLKREIKGCSNCITDAYFELMKLSIETVMNKKECQFEIRRGALLHDVVNYDVSKCMTQNNITDELALYHLKTNPSCIKYFSRLPENWEELVGKTEQERLQAEAEAKQKAEEQERLQAEAEAVIIAEIAVKLNEGETKTSIKNHYKEVKEVGSKKLTAALLVYLIKEAEKLNEQTE